MAAEAADRTLVGFTLDIIRAQTGDGVMPMKAAPSGQSWRIIDLIRRSAGSTGAAALLLISHKAKPPAVSRRGLC